MIVIDLYFNDETEYLEKFTVKGHAGYEARGKDIVCAAVSCLTVATVNALQGRYRVDLIQNEGFISCSIQCPDVASNLITSAFREGAYALTTHEQYKDYVKLHRHYLE